MSLLGPFWSHVCKQLSLIFYVNYFSLHLFLCNHDRQLGFGRPDFDHFFPDVLSVCQRFDNYLLTHGGTIVASLIQVLSLDNFTARCDLLLDTDNAHLGDLRICCLFYSRGDLHCNCAMGCAKRVGRCHQRHVNVNCIASTRLVR